MLNTPSDLILVSDLLCSFFIDNNITSRKCFNTGCLCKIGKLYSLMLFCEKQNWESVI